MYKMIDLETKTETIVPDSIHNLDTVELPLLDTESDYKWQYEALKSCREHPEYYRDEDITAVMAYLEKWLEAHRGD